MRDISPQSPEARRKRLASMRAAFGTEVEQKLKPHVTVWEVIKRVAIGVYNDGFIHAGDLRRDHPRHPAPVLRGEILRALLGISPGLDAGDPRCSDPADDRFRRQ